MTVRSLNGTTDDITCSAGAAASMTYGTFAFLIKQTASRTAEVNAFALISTSPTNLRALASITGTGTIRGVFFNDVDYDDTSGVTSGLNNWLTCVLRKGTGNVGGRWSIYNHGTSTWTHFNTSDTTMIDWPAIGGTGYIGFSDTVEFPPIRIAARALWANTVKWSADASGDTAIQNANLHTSAQAWLTANPDLLHFFNQASTSDPVLDYIGSSDQTSISGTTVVNGDDPPGFTFDLTGDENGVLTANLSAPTSTIAGIAQTPGTMAATLPAVVATVSGLRQVPGLLVATFAGFSAAVSAAQRETYGQLTAVLPFLANVVGERTHFGTATSTLTNLIATIVGGGGLAYLITTDDIATAMGREPYNATEEAAWQRAIVVVSNYINSKVRVGFATTSVVATYQADSYGQIYLREPVSNLSSVKNYRTQQEDLYVDFDGVYKLFNLEPQQVVIVTYTYGYSEPPQDIKDLATTLAIQEIDGTSYQTGLRRYKVGDVEEQYTGAGTSQHILDDMINGVLDNYRRRWYSIPLSLEYFPDYVPRGFEDDFGS